MTGTFDADAKTASGGGTFVHKSGGTVVQTGTLAFTRLVTFQFYGCGVIFGQPLPPDFCGGRAIIAAHLAGQSPSSAAFESDAILEVNCQIGTSVPEGTSEGIKLNIQDMINFNKHVIGNVALQQR